MKKLMILLSVLLFSQTHSFAKSIDALTELREQYGTRSVERLELMLDLMKSGEMTEKEIKSRIQDEVLILEAELLSLGVQSNDFYQRVKFWESQVQSGELRPAEFLSRMIQWYSDTSYSNAEIRARRVMFGHIIGLTQRLKEIQASTLDDVQKKAAVIIAVNAKQTEIMADYAIALDLNANDAAESLNSSHEFLKLEEWKKAYAEGKLTLLEFEYLVGGTISLQEMRDIVLPAKKRQLPQKSASEGGVEKGN